MVPLSSTGKRPLPFDGVVAPRVPCAGRCVLYSVGKESLSDRMLEDALSQSRRLGSEITENYNLQTKLHKKITSLINILMLFVKVVSHAKVLFLLTIKYYYYSH